MESGQSVPRSAGGGGRRKARRIEIGKRCCCCRMADFADNERENESKAAEAVKEEEWGIKAQHDYI